MPMSPSRASRAPAVAGAQGGGGQVRRRRPPGGAGDPYDARAYDDGQPAARGGAPPAAERKPPRPAGPVRRAARRACTGACTCGLGAAALLFASFAAFGVAGTLRRAAAAWDRRTLRREPAVVRLSAADYPLRAAVTVDVDATGVPHIRGEWETDVYFAHGWVQARERLFQLELFRRLASGRIAELFGPKAVGIDRWHRTVGMARLGRDDWAAMSRHRPQFVEFWKAFIAGINAYIARIGGRADLPVELALLGVTPAPFSGEEMMAFMRWHSSAMNKGWQNELLWAQLIETIGRERVEQLRAAVRFPEGGAAGEPNSSPSVLPDGTEWNLPEPLGSVLGPLTGIAGGGGSNAWAVNGTWTRSGRPIVCNDPHLPFSIPAAWHAVHLVARQDGVDIIGLGVPMMPFVIGAGFNGHVAWGMTLARSDVNDLFAERLTEHADGTVTYLGTDGEQHEAVVSEEVVRVKGRPDERLRVVRTPRGPVVGALLGLSTNVSLASLELQETATYNAMCDSCKGVVSGVDGVANFSKSGNVGMFTLGASRVLMPSLNIVYGDKDGNVGYFITGKVPRRRDNGDLPREGWNPADQWDGWVDFADMPHAMNPRQGFVVSANNRPSPDLDWANTTWIGSVWQHGWRAGRIEAMLREAGHGSQDADATARLQRDVICEPARLFARAVGRICGDAGELCSADAGVAARLLRGWDGGMRADSAGGAVYAAAKERIIRRALRAGGVDGHLADRVLGLGELAAGKVGNDLEGTHGTLLLRVVEEAGPIGAWVREAGGVRALVDAGLSDAVAALRSDMGPDIATWTWGRVHTSAFQHPLGKGGWPLDGVFNTETERAPGDADTVQLSAYLHQSEPREGLPLPPARYANRGFGASARLIADFGEPAAIRIAVGPGNSGRLGSPHYSDMAGMLTAPEGIRRVEFSGTAASDEGRTKFVPA